MTAGRRRAETAGRPSPLLAAPPFAGAVVGAAAWLGLVVLAVRLGQDSRWVLAGAVTVAAVVCLLGVFALMARTWAVLHTDPALHVGRRRRGHDVG